MSIIIALGYMHVQCEQTADRVQRLIHEAAQLRNQEHFDDAIALMHQALALNPDNYHIMFDLAYIYLLNGQLPESLSLYTNIVKSFSGGSVSSFYNIGYILKSAGHFDAAIAIFERLIALKPDYDAARLALSFALLGKGDFKRGWETHEWNLKEQGKNAEEFRTFLAQGTLAGKTILLMPEGGLGDTLHFIRYARKVKECGAHVIAIVQKPLFKLLERCKYIDLLLPSGMAVPKFDARVSYMTLPAIFQDTPETMPCNMPYIFPSPSLVDYWHDKIAADTQFKVGLCWQSDAHNDVSRLPMARRGCPLALFELLSTIPGISFYSLQKCDGVDQLNTKASGFNIQAFDNFDEINGCFMDTAALIHHLDMVITIDSAVAHLAGALGKPVWLLLPYQPDWRWVTHTTRSPWYPTMRIYRQPVPFDWESVMKRVHHDLSIVAAVQGIKIN